MRLFAVLFFASLGMLAMAHQPAQAAAGDMIPIYRFWSDSKQGHFYTASNPEKTYVENTYPDEWQYEQDAFYGFQIQQDATAPIYRFWSDKLQKHFYTQSVSERNYVIANYPTVWTYEQVAYYAYFTPVMGSVPVYRFWSDQLQGHFYTASESEKDYVLATYPEVWTYEEIAFYVQPEGAIDVNVEAVVYYKGHNPISSFNYDALIAQIEVDLEEGSRYRYYTNPNAPANVDFHLSTTVLLDTAPQQGDDCDQYLPEIHAGTWTTTDWQTTNCWGSGTADYNAMLADNQICEKPTPGSWMRYGFWLLVMAVSGRRT